jgi:hypothetical protein
MAERTNIASTTSRTMGLRTIRNTAKTHPVNRKPPRSSGAVSVVFVAYSLAYFANSSMWL